MLAELEACSFRNRSPDETAAHMAPILAKHLPLRANSSRSSALADERRKDHYSHFILRLAFASTDDLRRRFARLETTLFRMRFRDDDLREQRDFVASLQLPWNEVTDAEKRALGPQLAAASAVKRVDDTDWFKVDWDQVPELVDGRRVLVRDGKAYMPQREQLSLVAAEFTKQLDRALELTARALPRLDEDSRLAPILAHLSQAFTAPEAAYSSADARIDGLAAPTAANVDGLAAHFPLCMQHLHSTLRANAHLKHHGRLQYTLFLKGIGLSLEECLVFWRRAFHTMTDDRFNKEYRYNVRHAYGDVGGDANRRGRGYSPFSCQKLLTEALPGPGQAHGCPYRTFAPDNLVALLQRIGVSDHQVLRGVRDDIAKQKYHIACNRVFEHAHRADIDRAKRDAGWSAADLDTIVHPNAYFKRSWLLKHVGEGNAGVVEPGA